MPLDRGSAGLRASQDPLQSLRSLGGNAIPYDEEDPFIREEYEATLEANGAVSRMEPELYDPANEAAKAWGGAVF